MTRRPEATKPQGAYTSHQVDDPDQSVDLTDVREQRGMILSILFDFLEEDRIEDFSDWIDHVGFDLTALRYITDLPSAWLGHYRQGRGYDLDRALNDLLTWPPIAAHIPHLSQPSEGFSTTPNRKSAPSKK